MSGGNFEYKDFFLTEIAESIEQVILDNKTEYTAKELSERFPYHDSDWLTKYPEDKLKYNFSDEVIAKFKEAVIAVKTAYIYSHRIDYLLSGDDDDKSFLSRLNDDITKLEEDYGMGN